MRKVKKFKKVVEWEDGWNSSTYFAISILCFILEVVFFTFFGWAYGIYSAIKRQKENYPHYKEVYWEEISQKNSKASSLGINKSENKDKLGTRKSKK